jgi:hypothetical protein
MYWIPVAWMALCLCAVTHVGRVVHPEDAVSQIVNSK